MQNEIEKIMETVKKFDDDNEYIGKCFVMTDCKFAEIRAALEHGQSLKSKKRPYVLPSIFGVDIYIDDVLCTIAGKDFAPVSKDLYIGYLRLLEEMRK